MTASAARKLPPASATEQPCVTPVQPTPKASWRIDLLEVIPGLKWLLKRRWFQFAIVFPNLVFFYFFLMAGVIGSPVGNRNIIIIFVWILWWFLLISVMVPFASRMWCTVCPFPFFGEWFQRRMLIGARVGKPGVGRNRMWGLRKKWPKRLSNIWLQNFGFLAMCTFSALLLTRPIVSVMVLGSLVVVATILHMIFRLRAFCTYVCPVSGFLSLYSMTSMVEVRAKDQDTCARCKEKACLVGSEEGWGCPWLLYPSKLDRNNYCGMCMECIKTCPDDNMTVLARPFASDTRIKGYDEAWKAFIMLALAMVYSVTLLGPWGTLKDWANISEVGNWSGFLTYAGIIWFTAILGIPGLWALGAWLGKRLVGTDEVPAKELFLRYSFMLVPLGLFAWIAFSFPLLVVNGSYIISVASDPLGWGWNLLGTAHVPWTPVLPEYAVFVQIALLLVGLGFALRRGCEIAQSLYAQPSHALRSILPLGILCGAVTLVFLRFFVG